MEIIDRPELRSFLRNITELSFTTLIWCVWIYLFLPLLNFVLWLAGIRLLHVELIEGAAYIELLHLLGNLALLMLGVFAALYAWSYYNFWRYGKHCRRKTPPPPMKREMAAYYAMAPEEIESLQSQRELFLSLRPDADSETVTRGSSPRFMIQ